MSDTALSISNRFLTLTLGKDMFALDISAVLEILDMTEITRIPQAPPAVRGVVNVRGAAVPVQALALVRRGRYAPAPCAYRMRSRS